jgi:Holliday junction DNA helicase RuvA
MIAHLTGTLILKSADHLVIDVGGVGYSVTISLSTFAALPEIGSKLSINIYTHVREDQLLLYGFIAPEEKTLFQRLIGVSGVGPKTALAILSGIPANHLVEAIGGEDRARISSIPGVGKKTAERIILELKDRLLKEMSILSPSTPMGRTQYNDAISALVNLGYQRSHAEGALSKIKWSDKMPIEDAIRGALKELCRI